MFKRNVLKSTDGTVLTKTERKQLRNLILEILDNNSNRRLIKLLTEESGVERAEPGPRRIEFHFCARLEKPSTSETVAGRS